MGARVELDARPERRLSDDDLKGLERLHQLFKQTFPRFQEFGPQLRAAAQLSLEQRALERAGLLVLHLAKAPPRRRKP